ncbi:CMP-N-acetylneuraminate-beta-galactosamide-alpha-2,3-sialyltransferase 2-like [Gadus macrocephalus]|uniref:CMP-N-acetylneuraminate-beta-galactosamide- alpha-2,3-sialyltransferase 2-like n=1 Tax=Gadus macrocephalus TaxID=80720 RepID=UPI0028CBB3A7|nr:CMP-N-acetylneuraminate-beta-galactosamide-alpha-2,3-sialyltransferase 2-like [Gadus macrocephalus]XP_059899369.1 CMP-N-acetylneuraminate-beta-galactosamide-alpha-2,3-sialyltransferase 2-like [Gadus macrocephalus]
MPGRRWLGIKIIVLSVLAFTTLLFIYPFPDTKLLFMQASRLLEGPSPSDLCACPAQCVAETQGHQWFSERFNRSVYPLLTKENYTLPKDAFNWWMRLQSSRSGANFSHVMKEVFSMFPGESLYRDAGPDRCRSCAVVGNSGNLKGSYYGRMIDSNDFVIRMNQGPTQGFEDDVGARTTHHLMYPESAKNLDPKTSLVLIPYKILDLQWLLSAFTTGHIKQTYRRVLPTIQADRAKVQIYSPVFMRYAYDNWLDKHGRYPSTGFFSLMFALHICDEVSVFGYGADKRGNWDHYWEHNAGAGQYRSVHGGDYEYNITRYLATTNKIKMYVGT